MGNTCNCDSNKPANGQSVEIITNTKEIERPSNTNNYATPAGAIPQKNPLSKRTYMDNSHDDQKDSQSKISDPQVLATIGSKTRTKLPQIELETVGFYTGEWMNGKRDGVGEFKWLDGAIYTGEWREDMAHGKGKLVHADGDIYEGDWKSDMANGYGTYTHSSGAKYTGEWLNDAQHGKGVEFWPDGATYEGEYSKGK